MPDLTGAYDSSDSWVTRGAPGQVLPRLAATLGLTSAGECVQGQVGSRLAMRVWGALTPTSKIPMRLRITVATADAGTEVAVEAVSNQGWYAVSVSPSATRIYDRGFRALFARLREAAPPVCYRHPSRELDDRTTS